MPKRPQRFDHSVKLDGFAIPNRLQQHQAPSDVSGPDRNDTAPFSDEDVLLDSDELALFLGVSKSFVVKARSVGTGPGYIRMGERVIRYRLSDAKQWRDARQVRHCSPRRKGK